MNEGVEWRLCVTQGHQAMPSDQVTCGWVTLLDKSGSTPIQSGGTGGRASE